MDEQVLVLVGQWVLVWHPCRPVLVGALVGQVLDEPVHELVGGSV